MKRGILAIIGFLSYFAPLYFAFVTFIYLPFFSDFQPWPPPKTEIESFLGLIFALGFCLFIPALIAFPIMLYTLIQDRTLTITNRLGLAFVFLLFNVFAMPFFWHLHFKRFHNYDSAHA